MYRARDAVIVSHDHLVVDGVGVGEHLLVVEYTADRYARGVQGRHDVRDGSIASVVVDARLELAAMAYALLISGEARVVVERGEL